MTNRCTKRSAQHVAFAICKVSGVIGPFAVLKLKDRLVNCLFRNYRAHRLRPM